jgi:hypothetical protein
LTGLANGSTSIINHSITLPASFSTFDIEPGAIKVYAFMSDSPQGEIITAAKATPTFTNWPNVDDAGIVFSTATNDENCVGQPGSFGPTVLVGNYSAADLTSFDINYGVNGGSSSDSWSGTLGHNEKVAVNLAATNFTYQASNTLDVTLTNPNGTTDPNTANNNFTSNFSGSTTTANASKVRVEVKGDGYMVDEATLTVRDGSGTALLTVTGNQWTDNSTQTWDIDVPNGVDCYTFELEDTYGDGWGYQTTSWCRVYNFTGDVQGALIKDIDSDNTLESQLTEAAELTSTLAVEEVDAWEVSVYPNPASSALNVTFNATSNDYVVEVMDLQGRTILSQGLTSASGAQEVNFDVNGIASGSYILNVKSATGVYTQNVVIK